MAFRLSIEDGPYVQTLEVRSGALTVGKKPPTGLALTSPGLSARHAVFRQQGDRVEIVAMPTKIGVRFRNDRIEHALLAPGDTVHLGWAKITLVEVTPEDGSSPAPPPEPKTVEWAEEDDDDRPAPARKLSPAEAMAAAAKSLSPATTVTPASPRPTVPAPTPPAPTPAPAAAPSYVPAAPPPPSPSVPVRVTVTAPAMPQPAPPVLAPAYEFDATAEVRAAVASTTAVLPATPPPPAAPDAEFVVLSRRAVRVLPWWGISVAFHALLFCAVLMIPTPPDEQDSDLGGTFEVRLQQRPQAAFETDALPIVDRDARDVSVPRPDAVVPMEIVDSNLPASANPKGSGGVSEPRRDDTGIVFDDGGGSPWAKPGGSSAIGVGSGARFGGGVGTEMDQVFGKGDSDRANAAAAGKLNGDPFTRSLVEGLRLRTTERNVKVVPGDYDHGELVMTALGLHHGALTPADLSRETPTQEVRAIFFNCTGRPAPAVALSNLAKWVEEGGWLLTTDWGVDNVVEKAFPGYVKVWKEGNRTVMTPDMTITFTIAPGKHALLAGLPPEAESARWWLEDSSILFTIEKPEAVEVLAQSADLERKHGSKLVAVTFKHGRGRVVHALGHMYQREGNLRGAYAMQRLLINFLHQAIKAGSAQSGASVAAPLDVVPPRLSLPQDVTAEATSPAGAVVGFSPPPTARDDVDGNVPVTCRPASGSTFPLGTTRVECSARDSAGNAATGAFRVTVRDTTPPTLVLPPAEVVAEATSARGANVSFDMSAIDVGTGVASVVASPKSGEQFRVGVTTVECVARDGAGLVTRSSFLVRVLDRTPPVLTALSVTPETLRSGDRQMVKLTPKFTATDAVTESPTLVTVSVKSSEADAGLEGDDLPQDVDVRENGDIYVRAERGPKGDGRVYTLTCRARDQAGNLSEPRTATVTVQ